MTLVALFVALFGQVDAGPAPVRYLALGDSFTIGTGSPESLNFPSQLATMLKKRGVSVRLENVAVNGYSTADVIKHELQAITVVKPTLVTLAIGANDLVRGATHDEYRARLKRIFKAVNASGARVFVLPQPDWSRAPIARAFGDRDELRASIESFNVILAEEAKAANATYVDLWPLFMKQAEAQQFADDGLHPHQKAYTAWAEALLERL